MGYHLHITRAAEWFDSEATPITLQEWADYVETDPEMRMDGFAEAHVGGDVLRVENDGIAVWHAYSGHEKDNNMAWFDHFEGSIWVKNPDAEIISKMKNIASHFRARVVGDEGEEY